MSTKEKLPKLVDVYRPSNPLSRRQLPLVVDENLTLVMDIKNSGIIYEGQVSRAKELEEFALKFLVLPLDEFKRCLQISKSELLHVLNQNVPCVGCRRSVERLYIQLLNFGHPTLDPVIVKSDGTITIREEKQAYQSLASIFHDHAVRLAKLIENQPKRNKKSVRCLLHSLDSQRSRPLTPVWRDVWDCMKPECKKDVCIIEAESLHATLETYLRKHRFCGECRTKVLKAYTLLVEDPEPAKEKGYVSSLYAGIKRCLPDKHIHLKAQTDYITKLINRAEPELLGSRRERHAKTLEIAQEEVLTCLGICMYERLHRVYMRVREEERTCQLFAAVAIHTLSRSFETAVEKVRGVSQLELLYEEFAREEQAKQIRKEAKKIKRKRRKEKNLDGEEKENNCCSTEDDKDDNEKDCQCSQDSSSINGKDNSSTIGCYSCGGGDQLLTVNGKGGQNDECDSMDELDGCTNMKRNGNGQGDELRCTNELWLEDCKCENNISEDHLDTTNEVGAAKKEQFNCKCDTAIDNISHFNSKKESGSTSDHSHDCGYSSENNNGCCETGSLVSSLSSSPEGSELACSDSCCQEKCDFATHCRLNGGLSLQDMLEDHSEEDDEECYISAEEVKEFKSRSRQVFEKRQELRETLQRRFAQFCVNGPPLMPNLFLQTKYASN